MRVVVAAAEHELHRVRAVAAPTACSGSASSKAAECRSIATPLAAATWPRSATSPSETSIIAVAPACAAAAPAAYGGCGRW